MQPQTAAVVKRPTSIKRILTSDIGGTNSRFALFQTDDKGDLTFIESVWLKTADATSFDGLLKNLEKSEFHFSPNECDAIVAAVPGPVEYGTFANLPNVPWTVDISTLKKDLGAEKCFLINDFVAQAFACRTRAVTDAVEVKRGTPDNNAPLAVMGAGTGLGHCAMVPDGHGGFLPLPAEAGHTAFPFVNREEEEYENFILSKNEASYIITENVVSGSGLSLLHQFFTGEILKPWEVAAKIKPESDTTIWFSRFYARACRHYCLSVLPMAGLYLAGGVTTKNKFLVLNDTFRKEFSSSPTQHKLLERIPISLIVNEESGLWGAAFYGLISIGIAPLQGIR